MIRFCLFVFGFIITGFLHARALELEQPIDCVLGQDCWIQQYADHDPGPAATDYTCGSETYNAHDGTDFRVRDTAQSVDVIAAAAGKVIGMRDGMDDRLINSPGEIAALGNRECGNGVVIDNGDGWQTQYCHMRKGSVLVKKGDVVDVGRPLGVIGFSGAAAFPHVHLSVRLNGIKIDPFSGPNADNCQSVRNTMWTAKAQAAVIYHLGEVISFTFDSQKFELSELLVGQQGQGKPSNQWNALVANAVLINVQKSDEITLLVTGPTGQIAINTQIPDRNKAQFYIYAGKKFAQLMPGDYKADLVVKRSGKVIMEKRISETVK
jgi:murein DD-endopeptidase MepM/ murein hydrolase activator NlpD